MKTTTEFLALVKLKLESHVSHWLCWQHKPQPITGHIHCVWQTLRWFQHTAVQYISISIRMQRVHVKAVAVYHLQLG